MKDTAKYINIKPTWLTHEEVSRRMSTGKPLGHEAIGIDFGSKRLDLSHIMFMDTRRIKKTAASISINPDSRCKENSIFVNAILEQIALMHQEGRAGLTIYAHIRNQISFLQWAKEDKLLPIRDIQGARVLYEQYTLYLRSRMKLPKKGKLGRKSGYVLQRSSRKLLAHIFEGDSENYIAGGIRDIRSGGHSGAISDSNDIANALNFYYKFFDRVADFILNKEDYPLCLDLLSKRHWVFPSVKYWVGQGNAPKAFDYENGKVFSKEEILANLPLTAPKATRGSAIHKQKKALETFKEANREKQNSKYRIMLADKGLMAYFMVLLAVTGANDSVLAMMPWDDEFDESSEVQHFKTIKPRAGHKNIRFEIQKEFMPSFRKFLKLRDYALQGKKWDYLFFRAADGEIRLSNRQKDGTFRKLLYDSIFKSLDPNLPNVTSRQFRSGKTRWIYDEHGLWAASIMAQSSLATILDNYSDESLEEQALQMSDCLSLMHEKMTSDNIYETSAGGCRNIDNPKQEIENESYKADCKNPMGCLFCSNYGYHPDSRDARKLYSIQFLVTEVLVVNAANEGHFDRVMGPLLNRISSILESIRNVGPDAQKMLIEVQKDVYEEQNLHSYWEAKMKMFYKMGVVR